MNSIRFILFFLAIFGTDQFYAQTCLSPDGQTSISFSLSTDGQPQYEMKLGETTVIRTSRLGLELKNDTDLMSDFDIEDVQFEGFDNTWTPVWGEESQIRNQYNEMFISLKQETTDRTMNIRFRVYNEGMGFRYEFPQQPNLGHFIVSQEKTQFSLTGDHTAFWIPGDYDTQEYDYTTSKLSEIEKFFDTAVTGNASQEQFSKTGVQTALQLKSETGLYINLHEAALINYPAMHLNLNPNTYTFESWLTPDAVGNMAYMVAPQNTPWRTVIASFDAKDILASRITYNLNKPILIVL